MLRTIETHKTDLMTAGAMEICKITAPKDGATLGYLTRPKGYDGKNPVTVANHETLTAARTHLIDSYGVTIKATAPKVLKKPMRSYPQSTKGYNAESHKKGR